MNIELLRARLNDVLNDLEPKALTIDQLKKKLENFLRDRRVVFSFGSASPTVISSYRGNYSQPSLGYKDGSITVGELLTELDAVLRGRSHMGYKGNEYTYSGNQILHVANWSYCTDTFIADVVNKDGLITLVTFEEQN